MAKKFPIHPANPERICWGCDQFCAINAMACSNERSPHPSELFGDDWLAWGEQQFAPTSVHSNPVSQQPDSRIACVASVGKGRGDAFDSTS